MCVEQDAVLANVRFVMYACTLELSSRLYVCMYLHVHISPRYIVSVHRYVELLHASCCDRSACYVRMACCVVCCLMRASALMPVVI